MTAENSIKAVITEPAKAAYFLQNFVGQIIKTRDLLSQTKRKNSLKEQAALNTSIVRKKEAKITTKLQLR